jgi:hypothetical protein
MDIIATVYGFVMWYLPIVWMFLFQLKTSMYNKFFNPLYKIFLCVFIVYVIFFISPSNNLYLMMFYSFLGLTFVYYLVNYRKWNFPEAMSIGTVCTLIGSYYWESPFLVYNAITRGFELDWILHITGLFLFWFIWKSVGWNRDKKTLLVVFSGFILATGFMVFGPPTGLNSNYVVWNSLHFMTIRLICTLICFYAVNKSIPKEVKK